MKLVRFARDGQCRLGAAIGTEIADLGPLEPDGPSDWPQWLGADGAGLERARRLLETAPRLSSATVRLLAPIGRPPKILGVGLNYADHVQETSAERPAAPVIFNKQSTAVIGPGDSIFIPPESARVDYEGELAVVIGRRCRRVAASEAMRVVAGYTICNDVSVRDWQRRTPTMTMGKSWDSHCPLGPWIVTADEIPDPHALTLRTYVNDEMRQNASTGDMLFSCFELIEHLSTAFTLEPGDVISTGTPAGVGAAMKPPCWLVPGDTVRIEVEGIGTLSNTVAAEVIPA